MKRKIRYMQSDETDYGSVEFAMMMTLGLTFLSVFVSTLVSVVMEVDNYMLPFFFGVIVGCVLYFMFGFCFKKNEFYEVKE